MTPTPTPPPSVLITEIAERIQNCDDADSIGFLKRVLAAIATPTPPPAGTPQPNVPEWAKRAADEAWTIKFPVSANGWNQQCAAIILKHAPQPAPSPDTAKLREALERAKNGGHEWCRIANEALTELDDLRAQLAAAKQAGEKWEARTRWLMEQAAYKGGGNGGRFTITFTTPLDSECDVEQLDAARATLEDKP